MGIAKKMEWLKWIRKYSTGILDSKTGSMETLIDSVSSKTINNYGYSSSVVADDEFISRHDEISTSTPAATPKQRPMLPPPISPESPTPPPSLPNNDFDCYVSLDGIPIKQEFQYTVQSETDGCGKITKHDIEGLASKILESMYGTTMKLAPEGKRTVKVTLNVRQSATDGQSSSIWSRRNPSREKRHKSSRPDQSKHHRLVADTTESAAVTHIEDSCPVYAKPITKEHYKMKQGAQRYRRDQLVEMVSRSLAENLSFQNQRKSNKPESYHRTRTKRRVPLQSETPSVVPVTASALPVTPSAKPKSPSKVAWSPYDFEPVAHVPSAHKKHHHHHREQQKVYGNTPLVTVEEQVAKWLNQHSSATAKEAATSAQEQDNTKNNHQRYKRAKLASKKIHHHIHEHHHYHHYDYYIV
ncbi:protein naked cuticle homolog 2-like [Daktulosphaira vitifoliae]|uniref:protein naked cuticle homolog 2-like n=1 Tax=Daktulosphaira vitifoliae TaxID=58002 RepID=UPI0021A9EBD6|nr:protein naked cuticle homolog 2-like [Daktulosphaira vitifoliae]